MVARERVATAAIALTTAIFLLISLASYVVFGEGSQSGETLSSVSHAATSCLECVLQTH